MSDRLQRVVSRATLSAMLAAARLSWKKCKKLLGKRNPDKRQAFLGKLARYYDRVARRQVVLVYIDESHFHRDLDLGYTWGRIGERVWRVSDCPPLADRLNWYGAYNFTDGACLVWAEGACNKENTVSFLRRVNEWVRRDGRRLVVIWDGAPWHRAQVVQDAAHGLDIALVPLPGYSPDLNPIEGLWKWMREDVTRLCCHPTLKALFDACKDFVETINKDPLSLVNRLWPRFDLDPDTEKLGFSN